MNQPIRSFLVGCPIPCPQGTNVQVGLPQPRYNQHFKWQFLHHLPNVTPKSNLRASFSDVINHGQAVDMIGQDPSVPSPTGYMLTYFGFYSTIWNTHSLDPSKGSAFFLKPWTPTGYSSNSNTSHVTTLHVIFSVTYYFDSHSAIPHLFSTTDVISYPVRLLIVP